MQRAHGHLVIGEDQPLWALPRPVEERLDGTAAGVLGQVAPRVGPLRNR